MTAPRATGRTRAPKTIPTPEPVGRNVASVQAYVDTLDLDERATSLAALALTLAAQIDAGAGLALAGVSKELRAVLDALTPVEDDDDDAIPGLSAPVVDSKN